MIKKDASGKWVITAPKPFPADQAAVAAMTAATTNLRGERVVDENATDLASYGLAPPALAVTFTTKPGRRPSC